MTGNTLEQRARELLAAEVFPEGGFGADLMTDMLIRQRGKVATAQALSAIEAALRLSAGAGCAVADAHGIAAMAENVVTDDATLALLVRLRNHGGVGNEAADLIEWFIDQRSAGEEYVIRADKEDPVGVIYTGVEMIGEIVRLVTTGRRIKA